jgi:hypothetical protein
MLGQFTRASLLLAAIQLVAAPAASAQTTSGRFLTIVRGDTIAIEKFTRTATRLTSEITQPGRTRLTFTAELLPDASVSRMEFNMLGSSDTNNTVVVFKGDTAHIESRGQKERRPTVSGTVPIIPISFALIEQAVLRSAKLGADIPDVPLFSVVALRSLNAGITRPSADSAVVRVGNINMRFKLNSGGLLESATGVRGEDSQMVRTR